MKLLTRRNAAIVIFSVAFVTAVVALFIYNWQSTQVVQTPQSPRSQWNCVNETWCVNIYGDVQQEAHIGISKLMNGSTFTWVPEKTYSMVNSYGTQENVTLAGVSLASIFNKTQILSPNATDLEFIGVDGYASFELPISVVLANPNSVILASYENGHPITTKSQGGDGPIESFVILDVLQNNPDVTEIFHDNGESTIYNSTYKCMYCDAIKILEGNQVPPYATVFIILGLSIILGIGGCGVIVLLINWQKAIKNGRRINEQNGGSKL